MSADQGWLRRLAGFALRHRGEVAVAVGAAVLSAACQTSVPLVARHVVDDVIVAHRSPLLPALALLLALVVATFWLNYTRRYHGGRVALRVQNDLRAAMQEHLLRLDQSALRSMPTGQLVGRANGDSTLVQALLNMVPIQVGNLLLLTLSLAVMLVLSPLLALVSLAVVPAAVLVAVALRARVFPATWDAQQREGDLVQLVDEDLGGVRVVKAFGREQHEVERLAGLASDLYGSQMRAVRLTARYQPWLAAIPAFGQVGVLALGGWLTLTHQISIGTFVAFSTYIASMAAPARMLANVLVIGQQARAGVERILQLLDTPPAIADAPDAVPVLDGALAVDLDHVSVEQGGVRVLSGLDLHLAPGERVAIVGPSGSGKSTITALLPRFTDPQDGAVHIGGADVRGLRLDGLRRSIGMVFEESFLFSESVLDNIAYGRPGASRAEVEAVARVAQADGFITALPRGYDTVVGERGLSLSGGQRQRIAIARALLGDPRILVLDDATSAIDATTERAIHDGLRDAFADRTVLIVAHRESTLRLADRIVVLDRGRVVAEGTHDALLEESALYRVLLTGEGDPAVAAGMIEAIAQSGTPASPVAARTALPSAPSLGAGLGGARIGRGTFASALAPTPELLARVDALGPAKDVAPVDLARDARPAPGFSLRGLLVEYRRPLSLALALVVLDAAAGVLGPALVRAGIDDGVQRGSLVVLLAASAAYLAVVLADVGVGVAQAFVSGRTAQRVMLRLRIRVWAQLQRLSLDFYEREMAGRIMTRMTTDVDQFESLIETGLLSALVAVVTFVGVGVALVVVDVPLGLATLCVVPPLAVVTALFRRRAAVLYDEARDRIAIVNADFQESLSGAREAQAFVHEPATTARFRALGDDYLVTRVAAQRLVALYFPFVQLLSGVADVIVLGIGAGLIAAGHLTAGTLVAFLLYVDLFFSPVQQLSLVFDAWQQTRVSVARIGALMALTTATPDDADPLQHRPRTGEVELEDVRFAYPQVSDRRRPDELRGPADARPLIAGDAGAASPPEAIRGVTLAVRPGETLALVGETGAGKSTVMKLIARFYDVDRGAVLVGDTDVRRYDIAAYRRGLGYVPQESFLFSGTIADNIAFGRPDATRAEIEAAARAVDAHDVIAAMPGGYERRVAERGTDLSAGHRQLIALARAQLVDPVLLLLDEATSNLDLATEARVTAAMERLARGRTTVLIAHRLQTARAADRIAVLRGGRVAEVGSHDELLEADGRYAAMWRAFRASEEQSVS